jgi:hypothetical protein
MGVDKFFEQVIRKWIKFIVTIITDFGIVV